jgi:hypothetical protein
MGWLEAPNQSVRDVGQNTVLPHNKLPPTKDVVET